MKPVPRPVRPLALAALLAACPGEPPAGPDPCAGVTCSGHGRCVVLDGEAACACDEGYARWERYSCVLPRDACDPNPCNGEHRSVCEVVSEMAVCRCDPGYALVGDECAPADPCTPNPCTGEHRHVCTVSGTTAVCGCDPGWSDQAGTCEPADPCDPNPCTGEHRHVCAASGATAVCGCDPGWSDDGGTCVPADPCDPNPCVEAHRTACARGAGGAAECRCDSGWVETDGACVPVPVCDPNPCTEPHRSRCSEGPGGTPVCGCDAGWVDRAGTCVDDDPCDPNPCTAPHRGACAPSTGGTAVCRCDAGYVDVEGECRDETPCDPNPCTTPHRTNCLGSPGYPASCACDSGWYEYEGQCLDADPCSPNPCTAPHRTVCSVVDGAAACACDEGWMLDNGVCQPPVCTSQHATGDAAEPDECPALARAIALDVTADRTHEPAGDVDWFKFNAEAGRIVRVEAAGGASLSLALYGPGTSTVGTASGTAPALTRRLPATTLYTLSARRTTSSATGAYQLVVRDQGLDDHSNGTDGATPLSLAATAVASIETGADVDVFAISAQQRHVYLFEETTGFDASLRLGRAGSTGYVLTTEADTFRWEADQTGVIYFYVKMYSSTATGPLSVRVTDLGPDDHSDSCTDATALAAGASDTADIESPGDRDVFAVPVQDRHVYRLEELTTSDARMTLSWPGGTGNILETDAETLLWEAGRTGTVCVSVRLASSTAIASLILRAADVAVDDHADGNSDATPLSLGVPTTAVVESPGDRDVFALGARARHVYLLQQTNAVDTRTTIWRPGATSYALETDRESFRWKAPAAETVFVHLRLYNTGATGAMSLTATDLGPDDHADAWEGATPLAAGATDGAVIESEQDRDAFAVPVQAGHAYEFAETTAADARLQLWREGTSGYLVDTDSETVRWKAPADGTVYFYVQLYSSTALGALAVRVTDLGPDDHGNTFSTATELALDTDGAGALEVASDTDWFTFLASTGTTYTVRKVSGSVTLALYGPDGTTLLGTSTSSLLKQLQTGARYYVKVYGSAFGSYVVRVED